MSKRLLKPDTPADSDLKRCLDATPMLSFKMIAGAGSGKTTSLVKALAYAIKKKENVLRNKTQKVACITYTEVAATEIWHDVGNNPQAIVSTIHSFLWLVVNPFQKDIKKWVMTRVEEKIEEITNRISEFGPRVQARTREKAAKDLERYEGHKAKINQVTKFIYGTGSDFSKGTLGHDDVIKMSTELIQSHTLLRTIISQRFPIVFVDESQDTNPDVVAALKAIDVEMPNFCLGFFGDPMQKIYATGIGDIQAQNNWVTITKPENFRNSPEVLNVINAIRMSGDGLKQTSGNLQNFQKNVGSARIFILKADENRENNIALVRKFMAAETADFEWNEGNVKQLVIVHRMAAKRLGFADLYSAMNDDNSPSSLKDGLLDGTAWPLKPLLKFVIPLLYAKRRNQNFEVLSILRNQCPLLDETSLAGKNVAEEFASLKGKIDSLDDLVTAKVTIGEIFEFLLTQNLYLFEDRLLKFLQPQEGKLPDIIDGNTFQEDTEALNNSMKKLLLCSVNELWGYRSYIEDQSPFATQHGIKGTEFDRVLSIMDDEEGTHLQFSYDKYFGLKELSERDLENMQQGKETTVERTRRLFYVCCSRAIEGLAVIYFVDDVDLALNKVIEAALFKGDSIHTLADL